jgi:hypothetical protein
MAQYVVDCACCSSSSSSSSSGCQPPNCGDPPSPPQIPSSVQFSFILNVGSDNTGDSSCLPPCTQAYSITLTWGGSSYEGLGDSASGPCNDAGIFPHVVSAGVQLDSNGVCRWQVEVDMQLYTDDSYCVSRFLGPGCISPVGDYILDSTFTSNCPPSNGCNNTIDFGTVAIS